MTWLETTDQVLGICEETFGEIVVYTPQGQDSISLNGIYDDLYEAVDPNSNTIITSDQPILGIRNSDLGVTPHQGDAVTVRGENFTVKEVQTDGQGGSKLFLHRAS